MRETGKSRGVEAFGGNCGLLWELSLSGYRSFGWIFEFSLKIEIFRELEEFDKK